MGVFDGSGSRGGGVFGGAGGGGAVAYAASRPKAAPKPSGIGGFFQNLGSDIRGLAGVPAGLYGIGKAALHDAGKAAGFAQGEFQLDDIGKAAASGLVWTYAPLRNGNFGEFGRRLYAHPLSPILDAATVVTGGGAAVGKIASKVAADTGSTAAMRLAGLQRVNQITPSTVRPVSGAAGQFAAATRAIVDPTTGKTLYEKPVVRNPIIRGRKELTERAYATLPASNYLSPTRRGARLGEAETRRIAAREAANLDRTYMNAYSKLSADEKDALYYMAQGFDTPERAAALMAQRADLAASKIAENNASRMASKGRVWRDAEKGADDAIDAGVKERAGKTANEDARVHDLAEKRAAKAAAALAVAERAAKAAEKRAERKAEVVKNTEYGRSDFKRLAAARTEAKAQANAALKRLAGVQARHDAAKKELDEIAAKFGTSKKHSKDLPNGKPGPREGTAKITGRDDAKAKADVQDLVNDGKVLERVMPLIAQQSPALARALEAQRLVNEATQATFIRNLMRGGKTLDEAKKIIEDRATMPLRQVGITPNPGEIPTILTHVTKKQAGKKSSSGGSALDRGMTLRTLDEEKVTTGANFLNARYDRDPSVALQTYRGMFAKEKTHERLERAISKAEPFDRAKHADGIADGSLRWIKKDDPLVNDIRYVDDSLDRIERDLGEDITDAETEALREAYDAMHDLILKEGSPGVVIPKAYYDELAGQFGGGRGILEKITDTAGALLKPWRHIVLSLKGSFYVNNFIGNLFLGIVAYGPRYILDVAKESLPKQLRDSTSVRISDDVSDLERTAGSRNIDNPENQSKAMRLDVFSRLGEKVAAKGVLLTEDNFRRGAMRRNLRVKADEFRKTQPGMTRHEAIEAVFNDKSAVDQLAEQTYGDLLDYSKLTPVERELLLPAMPFWNFVRSMTGRTIRMTLDEPWKLRVLLYFGDAGIATNEAALPDGMELPEYLKGMIITDPTGENMRVLSTYGMNPLMAPVDLATQIGSLFGKSDGAQNPLAAFSPFWKVPLEGIINKDLFTGQEIRDADGSYPNSIMGRMGVQAKKNIPQIAMLERYRYPGKYPAVQRDGSDTISQYLGGPVGTLRPENIAQVNAIVAAMEAREKAYREKSQVETAERARF